jgi:hypothetical protein
MSSCTRTSHPVHREAAPSVADFDAALADLAGVLNATTARLVGLVERALEAGVTSEAGMKTPAQWLAWKTGMSSEHAGQIVRIAQRRSEMPLIFEAFARGEVSADQVSVLIKAPAWAERHVLDFAAIGTVSRLRRQIRSENFEGDPDHADPVAAPKPPADRMSIGVRDGRWKINGDLDIDVGRQVEAALQESRDRQFDEGNTDVTWVDALVDVAERSIDQVSSRDRRDRYRSWLHVEVGTGVATTTDGWRVPEGLRDLLLCDGIVQPVWERDGVPFSVGTSQRIVPDRTRRVVVRRDRGCRVPGCNTDRVIEVHHIVHWEDGGPTDTWNLVCLCPRHHRMHHKGELGITGNADDHDGIEFTDASGIPIDPNGIPIAPSAIPRCEKPYAAPPAGRMNYAWVGLGWAHPNALAKRREQARNARAVPDPLRPADPQIE